MHIYLYISSRLYSTNNLKLPQVLLIKLAALQFLKQLQFSRKPKNLLLYWFILMQNKALYHTMHDVKDRQLPRD